MKEPEGNDTYMFEFKWKGNRYWYVTVNWVIFVSGKFLKMTYMAYYL